MADKYQTLDAGCKKLTEATTVSTGVAEAGDIIALDAAGKIDNSLLPTGIGADTAVLPASENLGAGDFVNIFDDGGTVSVRLADNSNDREANGFVLSAVTAAANATVYFEGTNNALSGLTLGSRYYLDTAGGITATPVDPASAAAGTIHQYIGRATSATEINVEMDDKIVVA